MNLIASSIPVGSKVLITGATGFTGHVLAEKLCAMGLSVNAIARESSKLDSLAELPIKWYRGNVYDEALIKEAMLEVNYVFHVAAAFREAKIAQEEYSRVHVLSTKLLAEEAVKQESFRRFVHVSTMGVHGHIENPPGDESSPYAPGDEYQRTKLEAELWLRGFAEKNSLPFTIIRPTGIFGPGDKRLLKVFKMAAWPYFPILGKGKCLYHLIHVDDLTDAILLAALNEKALGEAIIVGNEQSIPLEDIVQVVASEIGSHPRVLRIPVGPFFVLADICEALCKPFGIEPPIYRRRVAFYTKDRSFSTKKMQNVLQFTPKFSNEEGLRATARWYVAQGLLRSKTTLADVRKGCQSQNEQVSAQMKDGEERLRGNDKLY